MRYLVILVILALAAPGAAATFGDRSLGMDSLVKQDSTQDSIRFDLSTDDIWGRRSRREVKRRTFLITEMESPRQTAYRESFTLIDFNRVDGFFLGLGSSNMADLGPHDEIGINGGVGYSFADSRWQYFAGTEYRVPLQRMPSLSTDTTISGRLFHVPMTLAVGAEVHNQTVTEDHWRARRLENMIYSFFAREDFRDYYKQAGWSGYIAFRPQRNRELRIEWRSDKHEHRDQQVFYGRWGGNKRLPKNPHENPFFDKMTEGKINSLTVTYQAEGAEKRMRRSTNLLGDSIDIDELRGFSSLFQIELGHMPGTDHGFNRYLLDLRSFRPIIPGLAWDTRLRYEAGTGDVPYQKLQALGGPGSLPAMRYKELLGNRLILLNTELRAHLALFSSYFEATDLQVALLNDFGYVGGALPNEGIFEGFSGLETSTIAYNVGVALGHIAGLQIGAYWRTDRKDDAKFFFRLERPF